MIRALSLEEKKTKWNQVDNINKDIRTTVLKQPENMK